jgi:hypothetical protein
MSRDLWLRRGKTLTATYNRKTVNLPTYEVVLDGKVIGRVERGMLTRERRTPGKRYVNARWRSPGWRYYTGTGTAWGRSLEATSRRDGVERILRHAGWSWSDASEAAKAVKVLA